IKKSSTISCGTGVLARERGEAARVARTTKGRIYFLEVLKSFCFVGKTLGKTQQMFVDVRFFPQPNPILVS
ncbi:MAG: hypothetical protein SAK29_42920, partial [Scytonema sp. PMC 1069.18]|nr:hypothetical protein [Scytonema sp. PMC 1069.18]